MSTRSAAIRLESEEKREANEHDARRESDSAARMIEKKNRRMKKFEQAFAREFKWSK